METIFTSQEVKDMNERKELYKKQLEELEKQSALLKKKLKKMEADTENVVHIKKATVYVVDFNKSKDNAATIFKNGQSNIFAIGNEETIIVPWSQNCNLAQPVVSLDTFESYFNNRNSEESKENDKDTVSFDFFKELELFGDVVCYKCKYTYSSCVAYVGYCFENNSMIAGFKDARGNIIGLYVYYDVEYDDFVYLLDSESLGREIRSLTKNMKFTKCNDQI